MEFEQLPGFLRNFSDSAVLSVTSFVVATIILSVVLSLVRANGDALFQRAPSVCQWAGRFGRNGEPTGTGQPLFQRPAVHKAIAGLRPFEDDPRTLLVCIPQKPTVLPRQFVSEATNVYLNTRCTETFNPSSSDCRI